MTKRNLVGKIFGIALAFVMVGSMFGGLATASGTALAEQAYYATREEAVSHVPTHVVPKDCFVWKDGPDPACPWRVIPGTGCAHWVAHELGLGIFPSAWQRWEAGEIEPPLPAEAWEVCYDGFYIRVADVIAERKEFEIKDAIVGDIWTNEALTHTGIVRQVQDGKVLVEHCSSAAGGVVQTWFSSGKCWRIPLDLYDQDWFGWQNAVGNNYATESFEDAILNPGVSVVTDLGYVDTTKGVWWDRLVVPSSGQTTTVWQFDKPIVAFGGTWNPGEPGGPGASIAVFIDGSWINVGVISNTYVNVFWGFVSSVPFTEVRLESYNPSEGWCETYELDNMVYSYPAQGVQIILPSAGETFWIEAEPEPTMPTIAAKAELVDIAPTPPLSITEFIWDATIRYTEFGRDDSQYIGPESILGETWTSWTPDFKNIIMGGEMEITVSATIDGNLYQDKVTVYIRGRNPSKITVKEELGNLILQAICYKETWPGHHWFQFHPEGDPRWGLPEHEREVETDGGWGLMQITWEPTFADIWNWQQNIKSGRQTYKYGESFSRQCVKHSKELYPEDKAIIKLSKAQREEQASHYYNRGGLDGYYWVWDPTLNSWYINPSVPLQKTGRTYAQDIMQIVSLVDAGTPPPDW